MKSNSKHLALIMALLMCLSLAACGDGGDSSDDDYRASAYGPLPTATYATRSRSRQLTAACTSPCTRATT